MSIIIATPTTNAAINCNMKKRAKLIKKTVRACLCLIPAHTKDGRKNTHRDAKLRTVCTIAEVICPDMRHLRLKIIEG